MSQETKTVREPENGYIAIAFAKLAGIGNGLGSVADTIIQKEAIRSVAAKGGPKVEIFPS